MRLLLHDIRHSTRTLLKRPAAAAVVVLTLALGLGANAAVFALVDALVLRPFRFPDADRVVLVAESGPGEIDRQENVSPANFLDWRRQMTSIHHLTALDWWDVNLVGRDEPERVLGFRVSAAFFQVLGVRPALGRGFVPDDETEGRHLRVVLSHALWERRFGADPAIVGTTVLIDAAPHVVVGVAPKGFDFPNKAELWGPLVFSPEIAARRSPGRLTVIGRLAAGRSLDDARSEASLIADRLAGDHPETNRDRSARVFTLARGMLDTGLGPILSLWQASGAFVLLIACANIANLLIARGLERRREIAVRLAIGAGRGRIVRELLVEHALLAALAVPISLFVAGVALRLIKGAMPASLARFVAGWQDIGVDARLTVYTLVLASVTIVIFGLLPALHASRHQLVAALNEGGRSAAAGAGRHRLRRALVVAELALALPLLVAAGLSVIGVQRYLSGPQGYDPNNVLVMRLVLPEARYPDASAQLRFTGRAVEALERIPGVKHATAVNIVPSAGGNVSRVPEVEGHPAPHPANAPMVDFRLITPGYFATLRIPVVQGRPFSNADREGAPRVAIVSRSMAERYWPTESPIGRRVRPSGSEWLTVVGVAGDVIHNWFVRRNHPTLYVPYAQQPTGYITLAVLTSGDPLSVATAARASVREIDPTQPMYDVMTVRQLLNDRTIGLQYIAAVMTVFGAVALVLAAVGTYAVMAFLVTQRTHEFGVRMAVGATPADVMRLGIGQAVRLASIGVALGAALSAALSRLIEAGLLGVVSSDARLFALLAALLGAVTLLAGYLPARRAARLDPVVVMRGG